jgi:hypothetical protein
MYKMITIKPELLKSKHKNPMLGFGFGPTDKRCKHCAFLIKKVYDKNYYKCKYRNNSNSAATDHRINWPACAKFIEAK